MPGTHCASVYASVAELQTGIVPQHSLRHSTHAEALALICESIKDATRYGGIRSRIALEYNRLNAEFLGVQMDSWKKAAVLATIGAAAILFMKKRYPAGVLATGVGLAVLASEYPEKFEQIRRSMPDYFERGMQVMEMAASAGRRISEAAGRSAVDAWDEISG